MGKILTIDYGFSQLPDDETAEAIRRTQRKMLEQEMEEVKRCYVWPRDIEMECTRLQKQWEAAGQEPPPQTVDIE